MCRKKKIAWGTDEVREAAEKRKAYKKNAAEKCARKGHSKMGEKVQRESRTLVKRLVRECKERDDEEFGRKRATKYQENMKLSWKEVKRGTGKEKMIYVG